ncbi:uncharacterized protein LOC143111733 isoform X1 [Alosa pseudoharengus]|uniref:uncharacterized protein LOC143111733 isoform X1 n=1 Tax=Alosa pseudoharengus TaxID=34774 RepID=UPI003F8A2745
MSLIQDEFAFRFALELNLFANLLERGMLKYRQFGSDPTVAVMGVKVLQCFPFYRHGKGRGKGRLCPPSAVPSGEVKPEFSSSSWACDSEGGGSGSVRRVYLSQKARISYRHQMDNVIDATY